MREGAEGSALVWAIVTSAAVPAAAAAGLPLWLAVIAAGEVVKAFDLVGYAALLMWLASIAMALCLVTLKFLMPLQAVQYSRQGLRPPMFILVTWGFAVLASVVLLIDVGTRFLPRSVHLDPSWGPVVLVLWLSIEVVGTLGLSAASLRLQHGPPPRPPGAAPIHVKSPAKQVSALSAEDLLAWLRSMLTTPDDQLPKGIRHFGDGETLITSERKLASALNESRTRVSRLLKRLYGEDKILLAPSNVDTHIRIPALPGREGKARQ